MHERSLALTFAGVALFAAATAQAHFILVQPASSSATEDGGKGSPPCGAGVPSGVITKVVGGEPLTIRLAEFVPHPGHYRVALSVSSRDELPPDPDVVADANGISISAAIQNPPQFPTLADGLFTHTDTSSVKMWQADIVLPNISCERCTLQVIEFMAEHGFNDGGGYFYHHCADLQITARPHGRRRIVSSGGPEVVVTSLPPAMEQRGDSCCATTSFTLTNTGDSVATVTLSQIGNFFTQAPASFTLDPGGSQCVTVTAAAQSIGTFEGVSIPRGDGTAGGVQIPITLLSLPPPD